ncbi:MAG: SDR family NAD(P)-dependent oxidoreductase, partial [Planctomycetota bacterium]|nr:SDR family NAD(P)-dependent oxidoreductase [Planctomycetota bacterium]
MASAYLNQLFGLDEQVAVVIGGTGVLGGALCDGIARAGATVVVAGRSAERGEARVEAIKQLGGKAIFAEVDAASKDSVESLLATALQNFNRCDMLVNCAGVNSAAPYFEIEEADFDNVLATNLKATHFGCQVFGRHMAAEEQGGAILNIGSVSAPIPLSRVYAYSASKAAVVNLTKNV